jgi:hypothetical protein
MGADEIKLRLHLVKPSESPVRKIDLAKVRLLRASKRRNHAKFSANSCAKIVREVTQRRYVCVPIFLFSAFLKDLFHSPRPNRQ